MCLWIILNSLQEASFDYKQIIFDYETKEFVEISEENRHLLLSEQIKSENAD